MFTTCEYCKDTAARGKDERQMAARKQELDHKDKMKNLEMDVYGRVLAKAVTNMIPNVTRVDGFKATITRRDNGLHQHEGSGDRQVAGSLGLGNSSNALVPVSGQLGGSFGCKNSSMGRINNDGDTVAEISFDSIHFRGCTCAQCR